MTKKIPLIVTVLLATFALVADLVVIPASGEIFAAFPNASPAVLTFILTGPLFASVVGAILSGFLAKSISKKYIVIGAQTIFAISACGGALVDNVYYIAVMRGLVGFSYGIIGAIILSLISELFIEEKERSFMMGGYTGVMAVLGIAVSMLSGFLAVGNWHNSFYVYLIAIPILLLMIFFLPKTPPEGKASASEDASKNKLPVVKVGIVAISLLIFSALYYIIMYYVAFYVAEVKIGDASTAGIYTSLGTVGLFLASLFFSLIYKYFKRATPVLFFLALGVAYIVMAYSHNVWVVGAMCLVGGATCGLSMAYYFMYTSMIVPLNVVSLAMAIITSSLSLGGFLSSYALMGYQTILHVTSIGPTFLYIGLTLCAGGVLSMILTIRSRKIA